MKPTRNTTAATKQKKMAPSDTESVAKKMGGRQPSIPKELTLKDIKDKIPPHYFKQNHWKSFYYMARDCCQIALVCCIMAYGFLPFVDQYFPAPADEYGSSSFTVVNLLRFAVLFVGWNIYAFINGVSATGLWVLAHECGHRAFSPSQAVNDAVGMVLHSALLVPYHSWRISHGSHHKNTNHLSADTVFVPPKRQSAVAE